MEVEEPRGTRSVQPQNEGFRKDRVTSQWLASCLGSWLPSGFTYKGLVLSSYSPGPPRGEPFKRRDPFWPLDHVTLSRGSPWEEGAGERGRGQGGQAKVPAAS